MEKASKDWLKGSNRDSHLYFTYLYSILGYILSYMSTNPCYKPVWRFEEQGSILSVIRNLEVTISVQK